MSSEDISNVKTFEDSSVSLLVNLRPANDIRRLNAYFLEVHNKLKQGGYTVGRAKTIHAFHGYIMQKYSRFFGPLFYGLHFLVHRVIPKVPFAKQIYFALTNGRNRILSKAEVLGRLYFCGFEVVSEEEIDHHLYFVARKIKRPPVETSPTYGPLVKLTRSGMNGDWITVYKFRTMHPYSEFLQDYIYRRNSLRDGGKINDDFRVTSWGKWMRKMWLDELPMFYNWIKGEIKFLGVRPLSQHYLSLYNTEVRKIRKTVKPGLIPPFYADMPKSVEEICESERRYVQSYLENPYKTQWVYFWRAFSNIVLKGARSG
jgi:hypothetical protein